MTTPKPILSESLNLMKFDFGNGITIELHNLNDSGKAHIWTWYSHNGDTPILMRPVDLNIMAPRSVDEQCDRYKKLSPGLSDFDWDKAFDYIIPMAMQAKRHGDPIIELGKSNAEVKKPKWDIYPLVVSGMPNIIFGDRGSLKSKLALVLTIYMTIHDLCEDNDIGIKGPDKSLKVLKLDFEVTQDADDYEWYRILRGLDMEGAVQLNYRKCRRPLADDVEAINDLINNAKIDVLIIDSLGPAAGGDLNSTEPALRFNEAMRQLDKTSLILAHTAKNQLGKRSVFGSSFYENLARNIWEVTKEESDEDGPPIVHIGLKQTKPPPFSSHHKPIAFQWDFDEDSERTIIQKYDANKIESLLALHSVSTNILSALKSGRRTPQDLADELGEPGNNVRQALFRLKKSGKVEKWGDEYGLLKND